MSTTVSLRATAGKGVSVIDETNYLAARSGSGEGTGDVGPNSPANSKMNVGIRSVKTKTGADPVFITHTYTITRHIIRFDPPNLPPNAEITDATLTLTARTVAPTLTSVDFSYMTSSVTVVEATPTSLIDPANFSTVNVSTTGSIHHKHNQGVTFLLYDDVNSGSAIPLAGTVAIPLNSSARSAIQNTPTNGIFGLALVNTKFELALTSSAPATSTPTRGGFTAPGNTHDLSSTDIHQEGAAIKAFGELGYGSDSNKPLLQYTYINRGGKISQPSGKIILSSGKISSVDS